MSHSRGGFVRVFSCCRKFLALSCISLAAVQAAADAALSGASSAQNTGAELLTVTLITGDRVVVGATKREISIQPGEGRTTVSFSTQYQTSSDGKTADLYV